MSYETVAENSRHLGKKYANEGNFGRAFSHYLVALKLKPEWRTQLGEEFSTVLCKWGSILDKRRRFEDLFMCYEQAVEVFPDNAIILNNLGAHLMRCGLLKEAAHYFRKSVSANPYFIRAAHNLENVSNLAVERWHFRMLNDQHRNEAFREAIIKKVRQGFDRVLDVGTGTGLLSLFSAEGKAKEIYACDSSPVMVEIAQQVFRSNNVSDVKLINKHSSELLIPEDIRERVSLLVTETFDAGLFGEDVLDTLSHGWEHLLLPPRPLSAVLDPKEFGMVIPFGASIYVTGVELDAFANDLYPKPVDGCNVLRNCGNYDTEDLSRTRFKRLTGTEKILEISFNDPNAIADILSGRVFEMTLKCTHSGRLDCFAVWFDLRLDEDIVLKTDPDSEDNSAWDQAIFPLAGSTTVEEGQDVAIEVSYKNKRLDVRPKDDFFDLPKFEASDDVIRTLSDEKLGSALRQAASELSLKFRDAVSVLDCYSFPVFGLHFLTLRSGRFKDALTCFATTENDRRVVLHVAEKSEAELDVRLKTDTCFEECLRGRRFDIILLDFVESNGEIKDGLLLQLEHLRSLLKPGGIILPEQAAVMGQFVYSDWLLQTSRVINNSVTCGFNIAEYINVYQARYFLDLDLKSIEHTVCSEPFELFDLLDSVESIFETAVPRSSAATACANALVFWVKIKFAEACDELYTNDDFSHHQAAILFSKAELPEQIKFSVIRSNGLFSVELLNS